MLRFFTSLWISFFCLLIATSADASLQDNLEALLKKDIPKNSEWSIGLVTLDDGKEVFSNSPDHRLIPASCMKVITCSAALLALGPDYTYTTKVYRSGTKEGDTLKGHLIVVGSGDPSIGGRFNGGDLTETFRKWAYQLKQQGIVRIDGDIVGVDRVFDDERHGLNWELDDYAEWYAAEVCSLSFNDACIDVVIRGGSKPGAKAAVEVFPPTTYMKIINRTRTVATRKSEQGTTFIREPESHTLRVQAAVRRNNRFYEYASVPDPALYCLTVLNETLVSEGIAVQGKVRRANSQDLRGKDIDWEPVASHQSPPLSELIRVCLKNSQNLYAEHFLKTLGYERYGLGSYKNGVLAAKDVLFKHGCKLDNQYFADGSGLSRENRLNANALIQIFRMMDKSKYADLFKDALPQSGTSGTLKNRMKHTAAFQRVRAKTGTLNGVHALSGYIQAQSGKEYVFAMLANGPRNASGYTTLMDRFCEEVVKDG